MTVTTFVSIKGAPGVTTLACLVGATWPEARTVAVVEADPFGGDLAVRFQLSSAWGWSSYVTAARRSHGVVPIDPHLQALPGGLDVIVLPAGNQRVVAVPSVEALLRSFGVVGLGDKGPSGRRGSAGRAPSRRPHRRLGDWRLVGTIGPGGGRHGRDPASLFKVRERAATLRERCGDRLALAVVGRGAHGLSATGEFTGLPVVVAVPYDIRAAQIASGERLGVRALSRSQLLVSARRLSLALSNPVIDQPNDRGVPAEASVVAAKGIGPMGRVARMLRAHCTERGGTEQGQVRGCRSVRQRAERSPPPPDAVSADEGPLPLPPARGPDEVPIQAVVR